MVSVSTSTVVGATTVIQQHCSPDLESFIINCKPFYSPCEFASFILVGVYIPPQANVQDAQRMLADQILCVSNPDYLVVVLGDFNKGNLTHDLPKYRQVIKCPTRGENILDHCYTTIRDAYHAVRTISNKRPSLIHRGLEHILHQVWHI